MTALIPPEFLFRYTFPVPKIERLPRRGKRLLNLPDENVLPALTELSGRTEFGEVRIGWNDKGLGIQVTVHGKSGPPDCDREHSTRSDSVHVWIDTRNTQTIHRASRFCHQFEVMPVGGGEDEQAPVIRQHPIARAKEDAPPFDTDNIPVQSEVNRSGYRIEVWLPEASLHGFDPARQPNLGFFYALSDTELGLQTLTVGAEFPFGNDPSLWSTLQLVGG